MTTTVASELSATERGFWELQRLYPSSAVSNIAFVVALGRPVGADRLRDALDGAGVAHPALRSRFPEVGGAPRRELLPPGAWLDLTTASAAPPAAELRAFARRPFDLTAGAPLRCLAWPDGVAVAVHHVAFDLGSIEPFVETLCGLLDGGRPTPGTVPVGFARARSRDLAYWTERLRDASGAAMRLPADRPPPAEPTFEADLLRYELPAATRRALHALARTLRATPNVVYGAAFLRMLQRQGAGDDLFVSVPVSLRSARHEGQVGCLFTTLPLRVAVDGAAPLEATVTQLRERWLEAIQHRQVSFGDIMGLLPASADDLHSPLYRHMFSYHDGGFGGPRARAAGVTVQGVATGLAHLDLELRAFDDGERARGVLLYSTDRYDRDRAQRYLDDTLDVLRGLGA